MKHIIWLITVFVLISSQIQAQTTKVNPADIHQNGATSGQVLKWDGTKWVPSADNTGTTYTDEQAQDAVGAMAGQTLTYTDATPLLDVKTQMSVTSDASGVKLSGDAASPGNTRLYGTNASGVKGWYAQPAGGGGGGTLQQAITAGATLVGPNTIANTADYLRITGRNVRIDTLVLGSGAPNNNALLTLRKPNTQLGFTLRAIPTIQGDTATGTRPYGNYYENISEDYMNSDGQIDAVWHMGYNSNGGGGKVNANEASFHQAIESHYIGGGTSPTGDFEYHIQSTAKNGNTNRHFSMNVRKDNGYAKGFFQIDEMDFRTTGPSPLSMFNIGLNKTYAINADGRFDASNTAGDKIISLQSNIGRIGVGTTVPNDGVHIIKNLSESAGVRVDNTSALAGASASYMAVNNVGSTAYFRLYGSNFILSHLAGSAAFGSSKGINIFTDQALGSGGTNRFQVFTGGYDVANVRLAIDSIGRVGIGTRLPSVSLYIAGVDAVRITSGTTPQQPTGASGFIRHNITTGKYEGVPTGTTWKNFLMEGDVSGSIGGSIASGQVAYGTGVNTIGGEANYVYDATNDLLEVNSASNLHSGFKSVNTSTDVLSSATYNLQNNAGTAGFLRMYGSNFALPYLADKLALTSTKGISVITDMNVASGGTNPFKVFTGGYNTVAKLTVLDNGNVGLNKEVPTDAMDIVTNINAPQGVYIVNSNASSSASASYGMSNNAGKNAFFRLYGSNFVLPHFASRAGFGSTTGVSIFPDASVGSGGPGTVEIYAGGSNSDQKRLDISSSVITASVGINVAGNVGIGTTTPTAVLHLKAGTATANTAPIKLTSGPLLTVTEPGAVGYNNSLYFTKNSGLRFGIGGIIFKSSATVPNVTTTETDLYSHTLPASALATENESVEAAFSVSTLGSATATTRNRIYFGGTLIYDSGNVGFIVASDFRYTVEIIRESATVVKVNVTGATTGATAAPYTVYTRITGLTLTNTQILKITGTRAGEGSASGDINGTMSTVKWFPSAG